VGETENLFYEYLAEELIDNEYDSIAPVVGVEMRALRQVLMLLVMTGSQRVAKDWI
jgi:hypothetical protein